MNIFKRKKSPKEVVSKFDEALGLYDISLPDGGTAGGTTINVEENIPGVVELDKNIERMRFFLFGAEGDKGSGVVKVEECDELSLQLQISGIFHLMNSKLYQLPFETRKNWGAVFRAIVQNNYGNISEYLAKDENQGLLFSLLIGYSNTTLALHTGGMLRECLKYENIASIILYSNDFYSFFNEYLVNESFDVASDAFTTFRDLLTRHVGLVSAFLDPKCDNYTPFFKKYEELLNSDAYVTVRQALKLLGELLLDRSNYSTMMTYINDKNNLRIIMNMLRKVEESIQFEAFHVFKVFVANPKKEIGIATVLYQNKEKIILFLKDFCKDKEDDEQFSDEKSLLISTLKKLKDPTPTTAEPTKKG